MNALLRVARGVRRKNILHDTAQRYVGTFHVLCRFSQARLDQAEFSSSYPFARIKFKDARLPVEASLEAFSPFIPLNDLDSGLAGLPGTVLRRLRGHLP